MTNDPKPLWALRGKKKFVFPVSIDLFNAKISWCIKSYLLQSIAYTQMIQQQSISNIAVIILCPFIKDNVKICLHIWLHKYG